MPSLLSSAVYLLASCATFVTAAPRPNFNPNLKPCPFNLEWYYSGANGMKYKAPGGAFLNPNADKNLIGSNSYTQWTLDAVGRLLQFPSGPYVLYITSPRSGNRKPGTEGLIMGDLSLTVSQYTPSSYAPVYCKQTNGPAGTNDKYLECGLDSGFNTGMYKPYSCSNFGQNGGDLVYLKTAYTADCGSPISWKINQVTNAAGGCNPSLPIGPAAPSGGASGGTGWSGSQGNSGNTGGSGQQRQGGNGGSQGGNNHWWNWNNWYHN